MPPPSSCRTCRWATRFASRGQASDDGKSIAALEIIVITRSAVQAVSDQIRQDWQKRGIGGPVSAVDPAAGTVTISISSLGGKKTIVVHTSKSTVIRRYAPDSVKPEDAKPSTLQDIHVGDQLRARGNRSADGTELAAEEIFTGVFPQFPSLIKSVDASAGTLSVQDLVSKKTVQLKITADSQLHKIPAEMAQRFATATEGRVAPWNARRGRFVSSTSSPAAANGQRWRGNPAVRTRALGQSGGGGNGGGARAGGAPSTSSDCSTKRRRLRSLICTRETPCTSHHPRHALRRKHCDQTIQRSRTDSSSLLPTAARR